MKSGHNPNANVICDRSFCAWPVVLDHFDFNWTMDGRYISGF